MNLKDELRSYFESQSPNYGYSDLHTLLEMLWSTYTQANPIDSKEIRMQIHALEPIMDSLSNDHSNQLFNIINKLYEESQRATFIDGIHVGAQHITELYYQTI